LPNITLEQVASFIYFGPPINRPIGTNYVSQRYPNRVKFDIKIVTHTLHYAVTN